MTKSFLMGNFLPRFKRLSRFFRQLIGVRRTAGMLTSSLALSTLELFGFALLFPFIKLATDPAFFTTLSDKYSELPLASLLNTQNKAIFVAGGILIAYFIFKAVAYSMLVEYQANVTAEVNAVSTERLLDAVLASKYRLFLDEGAVKITGIGYSNTAHAALLFQCLIAALNEIVFFIIILLSILIFEPWLVLVLLIACGVLSITVFRPLSRKVANLGHAVRDLDIDRHRFMHTLASAIRDIKIMGLEVVFSQRNKGLVRNHVSLSARYQTISASLRVLVEALTMIAFTGACVWLAFSTNNLLDLAPTLGTLGLVVLRSAPAVSRLAANYNSFRFSLPAVEALMNMCDTVALYSQSKISQPANLRSGSYRASKLCFSYRERQVLQDVSIEIPFGHVIAVVGASGSGKSTLLDLLAGLQQPSSGSFSVNGLNFDPFSSSDFAHNIGYVSQSITLLDATLQFNICLEESPDSCRLWAAVKKAHLESLLTTLPFGLQTLIGDGEAGLSGGQRQRVGIARALYRNPALLILDEVTSALDKATADAVMQELYELRGQTSLLIVSHDMCMTEADRIYQLDDGRLVELKGDFDVTKKR